MKVEYAGEGGYEALPEGEQRLEDLVCRLRGGVWGRRLGLGLMSIMTIIVKKRGRKRLY